MFFFVVFGASGWRVRRNIMYISMYLGMWMIKNFCDGLLLVFFVVVCVVIVVDFCC